jgi:hypothetical protein
VEEQKLSLISPRPRNYQAREVRSLLLSPRQAAAQQIYGGKGEVMSGHGLKGEVIIGHGDKEELKAAQQSARAVPTFHRHSNEEAAEEEERMVPSLRSPRGSLGYGHSNLSSIKKKIHVKPKMEVQLDHDRDPHLRLKSIQGTQENTDVKAKVLSSKLQPKTEGKSRVENPRNKNSKVVVQSEGTTEGMERLWTASLSQRY